MTADRDPQQLPAGAGQTGSKVSSSKLDAGARSAPAAARHDHRSGASRTRIRLLHRVRRRLARAPTRRTAVRSRSRWSAEKAWPASPTRSASTAALRPGGSAARPRVSRAEGVIREHILSCSALHELLMNYSQRVMHQLAQSALCNRFHTSVQRLARWLLLTAERADTNRFELTHEFVAQMVGAPRSAVSAVGLDAARQGHHRLPARRAHDPERHAPAPSGLRMRGRDARAPRTARATSPQRGLVRAVCPSSSPRRAVRHEQRQGEAHDGHDQRALSAA